jgi:hypothetical protein
MERMNERIENGPNGCLPTGPLMRPRCVRTPIKATAGILLTASLCI